MTGLAVHCGLHVKHINSGVSKSSLPVLLHQRDQPKQIPWGWSETPNWTQWFVVVMFFNERCNFGGICHCQPPMKINSLEQKRHASNIEQMLKWLWLKPEVHIAKYRYRFGLIVHVRETLRFHLATWHIGNSVQKSSFIGIAWQFRIATENHHVTCYNSNWFIKHIFWACPIASHSSVDWRVINFRFHHLFIIFSHRSPSLVEVPLISFDMRQLGHHDVTGGTWSDGRTDS